jgi:hypothetical protein
VGPLGGGDNCALLPCPDTRQSCRGPNLHFLLVYWVIIFQAPSTRLNHGMSELAGAAVAKQRRDAAPSGAGRRAAAAILAAAMSPQARVETERSRRELQLVGRGRLVPKRTGDAAVQRFRTVSQ